MAVTDSREMFGIFSGHACAGQQLGRIALLQRFQADAPGEAVPPRVGLPRCHRRFPAAENEPYVVRQYRQERPAKPGVHQAEHFIGVQGDNHSGPNPSEARRDLFSRAGLPSAGGGEFTEQTGFGRLDTAAIQPHYSRAFRARKLNEGAEKPGFSDPRNSMQMHDDRAVIGQKIVQQAKLFSPADEASGHLVIQQIPNLWHGAFPSRLQDHSKIPVL
jgi:hypothetical protein